MQGHLLSHSLHGTSAGSLLGDYSASGTGETTLYYPLDFQICCVVLCCSVETVFKMYIFLFLLLLLLLLLLL